MRIGKTFKSIFKRSSQHSTPIESIHAKPLLPDIHSNLAKVREALGNSNDFVTREFRIGRTGIFRLALLYIEGLVDTQSIQVAIMESLMLDIRGEELEKELELQRNPMQVIKEKMLTVGSIVEIASFKELFSELLAGKTILLMDGIAQGFSIGLQKWEHRAVTEPSAQTVIRGPREGFTETIRTNTALVRRRIKDPNLWLEDRTVGKVTQTSIAIMYIKGIVNEKVVEEVRRRLDTIEIDGILESGYIEELIQDETYTPFPTVYHTERPDVVAANLLEGRVAILVDGTPFVLIVPALFTQYYQAAEDYYQRADIATLLRILRFGCFFIALMAPSMYIAITTFHQELLPSQLLISLAAQREGVPFPAFIEALLMEVTFEILREAGVRLPKAVGQAVSIVGALVVGQAAVEAGLVSSAMVMVVSITAISSFVFPAYNMAIAIRILRFILMGLAASFGLFGIFIGIMALVLHMCSLRSFGIPYMSPFGPFIPADQKDGMFRVPIWGMFSRPHLINQKNVKREDTSPTPKPEPDQRKHKRGKP